MFVFSVCKHDEDKARMTDCWVINAALGRIISANDFSFFFLTSCFQFQEDV